MSVETILQEVKTKLKAISDENVDVSDELWFKQVKKAQNAVDKALEDLKCQ